MLTCRQCGRQNPDEARFCMACATPLPPPTAAAREVRKTVTVLFCDVVGSTELGERFDPEVMRAVMARFYAAAREPVERHGGTVEKVIGDALVAVFGIPVVHEDDALRAVRAALEMRDAVRAMGDIQARIGVNTGDVLARDATPGESLVVGDAVNVAARLEQAARAGRGAGRRGDLGARRRMPPAASAWRPSRRRASASRSPRGGWTAWIRRRSGHRRRLDLPMIGREAELDLLRWALDRDRPEPAAAPGDGARPARDRQVPARLGGAAPRAPASPSLTGHCRATPRRVVARAAARGRPGRACRRAAMPRPRSPRSCRATPTPAAVAACLCSERRGRRPDVGWAVSRLIGAMAAGGRS